MSIEIYRGVKRLVSYRMDEYKDDLAEYLQLLLQEKYEQYTAKEIESELKELGLE